MSEKVKVVIIGSGPAGLTAAIYTARADLDPTVIEGEPSSTTDQPGGQLMLTSDIENYPGFVDGIMGPELMSNFRSQAQRFGAKFDTTKVSRVDFSEQPFKVWTNNQTGDEPAYIADSVIISTGARSLLLNIDRETELIGHGISTCATCDGFFFRDQNIAVVGGGDSALEEAGFLTKFAKSVTVIHRRNELRASKIMQDRAFANPKLSFIWDSTVTELHGEKSLETVTVTNHITGDSTELPVTGLFVAIGHSPNTDLFKGQIDMDDVGYIITNSGTKTNVPGVFACGDVQDHIYRQAITAAGSGCMAAIDIEKWLKQSEN